MRDVDIKDILYTKTGLIVLMLITLNYGIIYLREYV